jgi:tetratricopeptide (TPR) repeat protein
MHGFVGEFLRIKAERDMALGQFARAIARYERAQHWSPQLASSDRVHSRLGEAYLHIGRTSHPNARFFLGERYRQARDYKMAIAEYRAGLDDSPAPLLAVLEKRLASTMVDRGMALFRRGGVGPATAEWERALAYDPSQYQAIYFLSKAYFEQARYTQSIAMGQLLLLRSRNPVLNANVQANIGDGYWKLEDYDRARTAYQLSMRLDSQGNFRGYKGLGGT